MLAVAANNGWPLKKRRTTDSTVSNRAGRTRSPEWLRRRASVSLGAGKRKWLSMNPINRLPESPEEVAG